MNSFNLHYNTICGRCLYCVRKSIIIRDGQQKTLRAFVQGLFYIYEIL